MIFWGLTDVTTIPKGCVMGEYMHVKMSVSAYVTVCICILMLFCQVLQFIYYIIAIDRDCVVH